MANQPPDLSRRERQIMDVLYARGEATAKQVRAELPDPPTPMAVRRLIQILEEKGHVRRRAEGRAIHFSPTRPRDSAGRADLRRVVRTFFEGSLAEAVSAYFTDPDARVPESELQRLAKLVREARNRGQ